jgi:DNA-damage-inducible protein J
MPTTETAYISVRTEPQIKNEAEVLFRQLGVNMTTAINMFLKQTLRLRKIPFEISATAAQSNSVSNFSVYDQARLKKSLAQPKSAYITKTICELKAMENA